jgi:hypothetical protein
MTFVFKLHYLCLQNVVCLIKMCTFAASFAFGDNTYIN